MARSTALQTTTRFFFIKNYSAQVLKANMKIVGATEHAVVLYRDKLPKFNNGRTETEKGHMIYNWFEWRRDSSKDYPQSTPNTKADKRFEKAYRNLYRPGRHCLTPWRGAVPHCGRLMSSAGVVTALRLTKTFIGKQRKKCYQPMLGTHTAQQSLFVGV